MKKCSKHNAASCVILFLFLTHVLFISCDMFSTHKKSPLSQKCVTKVNNDTMISDINLSLALIKEIDKFSESYDSISNRWNKDEYPHVLLIRLYKVDNNCYLNISELPWYVDKYFSDTIEPLNGYVVYKRKMIAFYNFDCECKVNLVDVEKLKKEKPHNFLDERSNIALDFINYSMRGVRFKVHNRDSLEKVFSGFM